MAGGFDAELAEQERERRFREASEQWGELEQKRLMEIFPTLDAVRSSVEKGDRKAMLELLTIATDSLRIFDALPQKTRESLADCLETMGNNLEEAKGFLPGECGKMSEKWVREHEFKEFMDAMAVELSRRFDGYNLEDAISKVAEDSKQNWFTIQKRRGRHHEAASDSLELAYAILQERGVDMPILLRPKRKRYGRK